MQGSPPQSRTRLAMTFAAAWKARSAIGIRSVHGNPGSAGKARTPSSPLRKAIASDPGAPEECPRYTKTPATVMSTPCTRNEVARTHRFRSPMRRWKNAVATAPARNESTETTDFVQPNLGESTGRLDTPKAANTVLPVFSRVSHAREWDMEARDIPAYYRSTHKHCRHQRR